MIVVLLALLAFEPITVPEVHELVEAGRGGEALPRVEETVLAAPGDRPLQKAFALVLRNTGALDSAVAVYRRLLASDPSDDDTRLGMGLALAWQERHEEALALYEEIAPGSEHYGQSVLGRARVTGWAGRYAEALRLLDEAEELLPGNREIPQRRAQVMGWAGDHAGAQAAYRVLAELDPENPEYPLGVARNLERSGRPLAARAWYRRALELAPGRADIDEDLRRVARSSAPRAGVEIRAAYDDDRWVRGLTREYRLRFERRFADRLVPSVDLAWSDNRRGRLGRGYLLARGALGWRPLDWLGLTFRAQGDAVDFSFKSATLAWELERSWLNWTGDAGRILFEPTQDIGAFSASTRLVARPLSRLRLEAHAARMQVINDGNIKNVLSAGAGYDILARPRLGIAYTFRFDDFRDDSPRYYSPRDLYTNTLGAGFGWRGSTTGLSAEAAGGYNTDREVVLRANAAVDRLLFAGVRAAFDASWEMTAGRGRYTYAGVGIRFSRSF